MTKRTLSAAEIRAYENSIGHLFAYYLERHGVDIGAQNVQKTIREKIDEVCATLEIGADWGDTFEAILQDRTNAAIDELIVKTGGNEKAFALN